MWQIKSRFIKLYHHISVRNYPMLREVEIPPELDDGRSFQPPKRYVVSNIDVVVKSAKSFFFK